MKEKFTAGLETRFSYSMRVRFYFQQDVAPPHTSKLALDWLKSNFNNRVISRKTDFEWAPHSPDLSPPPPIFSCGATWKIESTKRTLEPLVSSNQTSKQRLKPLTKKPAALWCPTSSAAWRCVSSRKEDIWRNCCRTGYTPVIVLRFYVIIFIHIKSIIFNFCFIVSIFVIVRIFFK